MYSYYHVFYVVYSECDINLCENGASCKKLGVSYICECVTGFTGSLCQTAAGNKMHTLLTLFNFARTYICT